MNKKAALIEAAFFLAPQLPQPPLDSMAIKHRFEQSIDEVCLIAGKDCNFMIEKRQIYTFIKA